MVNRYLGETEAKLRALFSRARAAAPCILFLDELDAITAKRGDGGSDSGEGSGSVHARVLSTLLNEMDGVASTSSASPSVTGGAAARAAAGGGGVLVLAATNRRDALDAALLRPGRLHESVELGVPGAEDRKGVLRVHAGRLPLAAGVDLEMLSRDDVSGGLTCADLEVRENITSKNFAAREARWLFCLSASLQSYRKRGRRYKMFWVCVALVERASASQSQWTYVLLAVVPHVREGQGGVGYVGR